MENILNLWVTPEKSWRISYAANTFLESLHNLLSQLQEAAFPTPQYFTACTGW